METIISTDGNTLDEVAKWVRLLMKAKYLTFIFRVEASGDCIYRPRVIHFLYFTS